MTHIEVMKQGLVAFELELSEGPLLKECHEAMKAFRQAIADYPLEKMADNAVALGLDYGQEPVAVWELFAGGWESIADGDWMQTLPIGTKLYTLPLPQQPPVEAQTEAEKTAYSFGWYKALESIERNFCSRCGKRIKDLTTIHTCTPP